MSDEQRGAIPYASRPKAPEGRAWDAAAEMAKATAPAAWRAMCTWVDSSKPADKGSYKLPHHTGDAAHDVVWRGVAAAMARLLQASTDIPEADRRACYNHLARHYKDFGKPVPAYRTLEEVLSYNALMTAGPPGEDGEERSDSQVKRYRTFAIEATPRTRAADAPEDAPNLYDITFSSETPILRRGFFGNWTEILGHSAGEVDASYLERGMAVLVDHRGDQVGVLREGRIDATARKGRGAIQFSRSVRGQELEQDVRDGVRQFISVGYMVDQEQLVVKDEKAGDTYRVTRWTPMEASLVSVPADVSVGVGRDASGIYDPLAVWEGGDPAEPEERTMKKVRGENGAVIEVADDDPRTALTDAEARGGSPPAGPDENERKYRSEVIRRAQELGHTDLVTAWVANGTDAAVMGRQLLEAISTRGNPQPSQEAILNLSRKEAKQYSYLRAFRIAAGLVAEQRGLQDETAIKPSGFEWEVHQGLRAKTPPPPDGVMRGGIMVPMRLSGEITDADVRLQRSQGRQRGPITTFDLGSAPELIFTQAGELIELLRSNIALYMRGGRLITGLTGPIGFPAMIEGAQVYWRPENPGSGTPPTKPKFILKNMGMKILQGLMPYTKAFLMQSSIDAEAMARTELAIAHGLALAKSAYTGSGVNGEPTGIMVAPDVQVFDFSGGAATYPKLVDMLGKVRKAKALRGSIGWISEVDLATMLRRTSVVATPAAPIWIWEGDYDNGMVAGYPATADDQMPDNLGVDNDEKALIGGNWADHITGTYGAMELLADPFTKKDEGIIEIASYQGADQLIRHGASFVKAKALKLA